MQFGLNLLTRIAPTEVLDVVLLRGEVGSNKSSFLINTFRQAKLSSGSS